MTYPSIHGFAVMVRMPSILHDDCDVVLVDRGAGTSEFERYVTGIVPADAEAPTEWWWGHYYTDLRLATTDALGR